MLEIHNDFIRGLWRSRSSNNYFFFVFPLGLSVCCFCKWAQCAACRLPDREQSDSDGPSDDRHGSHGGVRVLSRWTSWPFSGLRMTKARTTQSNAMTRLPYTWMVLDAQIFSPYIHILIWVSYTVWMWKNRVDHLFKKTNLRQCRKKLRNGISWHSRIALLDFYL